MASPYQPTSRRPIAGMFRRTAHGAVELAVRLRIHPDVFSYGSILAAAGAALLFWRARQTPVLLIPAVVLMFVRLWLNMFDGMVALAAGQASKRGEIINDLPDRVSDALIFAGVAHSGFCAMSLGYWGAIAAVFVAYVGLFGQAVGVQREFSGVMAKPYRMVALSVGALLTLFAIRRGLPLTYAGFTILDWTLIVILVGCAQTAIVRLQRIFRALEPR
jgi:phosphatidylglycerophosphate synthase